MFALLIRPSNLEIASPTLFTASVVLLPSSLVMLYVGPVNTPFSTLAPPPKAVAKSDLTVFN